MRHLIILFACLFVTGCLSTHGVQVNKETPKPVCKISIEDLDDS